MVLSRLTPVLRHVGRSPTVINIRTGTHYKTGGLKPEPYRTTYGIFRVLLTVTAGLLVGAAISKSIANFLEENDLFVPSDDDDDDD